MFERTALSRRKFLRAGILAGGATVLSVAALAGCGEEESATAPAATKAAATAAAPAATTAAVAAAAPKPATGEVQFWDWWNPTSGVETKNWFDFLKTDFEAKNPSLKINFQFVPFGNEYVQKFQAASAAGNPPDIMHSSIIWARDFFDLGTLEVLNDRIKTDPEMAMEKFLPGALFYNQKKGETYGIPMEGADSRILIWDKKMLQEAGLDPSFESVWSWTWEKFAEAAMKLTKKTGDTLERSGYLVAIPSMEMLGTWLRTQGIGFYNEEQTALNLSKGQAKAAIQFELKLLNQDKVSMPLGAERQDFQQFLEGKTAMVSGGTWNIAAVRNGAPGKDFDIGPYPQGPGGKGPGTTTWYNMIVMPVKGKNKDGAWVWAQYYGGLQSFKDRVRIMSRFAPRIALYESEEFKKEAVKEPLLERVPKIAEVGGAYPFIRFTETNTIFTPAIESIYVKNSDIDKTLAEIEEQANPLLTKAGGT